MDSRLHRRVRLRLPVRLRWTAPFGQRIETANTVDISRGGLLVSTMEPHSPGVTVWVTFPYDAASSDGQPEIAARVVRCGEMPEAVRAANARERVQPANAAEQERSAKSGKLAQALGGSDAPPTFAVAFHLEAEPHSSPNGHAHRSELERRSRVRKALAIPVRVHPERIPWFEEAMTIDVSARGLCFLSHREYAPGDRLKIAFEDHASAPWHGAGEFLSEVVRVVPVPGSAAVEISIRRTDLSE